MPSILYTAQVTATPGSVEASDGALTLDVHEPSELGGTGGSTNPEQLMAAALASCLLESVRIAAGTAGESIDDVSVDGSVSLSDTDGVGYDATYSLAVSLPNFANPDNVLAQAKSICPFLKKLDDVDVTLTD
ncbi:osmotically inducible protein OsmC [Rhodococcoides kyotonense]|uniref:Osmotically inducible protein OsmC n=1 Tax=Rhodococcoides kyotonense TaxID=398843 RepID=A0A177Y8C6_9NOCA|nr:osmotically inducible protein OsmC [Rhodococcus kyotonensis]